MLALEWRPRAQLDRESIAIYIGIECGQPQNALKITQDIDDAIESARMFPDSGIRFKADSLKNHGYRMVTTGKYMIKPPLQNVAAEPCLRLNAT